MSNYTQLIASVEAAVLTAASRGASGRDAWGGIDNTPSPYWRLEVMVHACELLGVQARSWFGYVQSQQPPVDTIVRYLQRLDQSQADEHARQMLLEFREATAAVEAQMRRAATRKRHQAMRLHTDLAPLAMRRIMRNPHLNTTRAGIIERLEKAGIRPTAAAIEAAKEAISDLVAIRQERPRCRRSANAAGHEIVTFRGTTKERLDSRRQDAVEGAARLVMPHGAPAGSKWTIKLLSPDEWAGVTYNLTIWADRNVYRGSFKGWAANGDHHVIAVRRDWLVRVQRRGLAIVAGAFTLDARSWLAQVEGVEVVEAHVAIPSRGYSCTEARRTYARTTGGAWVHVEPGDLTPDRTRISRCGNAERRRIMLVIYGLARYMGEVKARVVDESRFGRLYRWQPRSGEAVCAVEVTDATDPSRTYMLRVPPTTTTAHEAVAWTFGLTAAAYNPEVET